MITREEAVAAIDGAIGTLRGLINNESPLLEDGVIKNHLSTALALANFASLLVIEEEPRTGAMILRSEAALKVKAFSDAIDKVSAGAPNLIPFLFGSMMLRVEADKLGTLTRTTGPKDETAKYLRIYPGLNVDTTTGKPGFTLIFAAEGAVSKDIITPSAMPNRLPGVKDGDEVLEDIDPCKPPKCPKL